MNAVLNLAVPHPVRIGVVTSSSGGGQGAPKGYEFLRDSDGRRMRQSLDEGGKFILVPKIP